MITTETIKKTLCKKTNVKNITIILRVKIVSYLLFGCKGMRMGMTIGKKKILTIDKKAKQVCF